MDSWGFKKWLYTTQFLARSFITFSHNKIRSFRVDPINTSKVFDCRWKKSLYPKANSFLALFRPFRWKSHVKLRFHTATILMTRCSTFFYHLLATAVSEGSGSRCELATATASPLSEKKPSFSCKNVRHIIHPTT